MKSFSERLQWLTMLKKINQADLAKGLGKNPSTINKWWKGHRPPASKNLLLLVDFFKCDYRWLRTGQGEPFPNENTTITGKVNQIAENAHYVRDSIVESRDVAHGHSHLNKTTNNDLDDPYIAALLKIVLNLPKREDFLKTLLALALEEEKRQKTE